MAKETILIVEDEKDIAEMIAYNLEREHYKIFCEYSGADVMEIAREENPNLILMDIMLPDTDGLELCKSLRADKKTKNIPIVFLSAKSQEMDKILGLELGADDYITKPFSPRELLARIKAVLRRSVPSSEQEKIRQQDIQVDIEKHKVKVYGKSVDLTRTEFSILEFMVSRPGRVLSREKLINAVFGYDSEVYDRTVDAHIKSLRKKLGTAKHYIETVRGMGYRFKDEEDLEDAQG